MVNLSADWAVRNQQSTLTGQGSKLMKKGSFYFAIFVFALALFFFVSALTFGAMKSKLLPLIVSSVTLILAGIEVTIELLKRRCRQEDKESVDKSEKGGKDDLRSYITYFAWTLGLIVGIYLLGFLISIPVFILSFLLSHGQRFSKSVFIAAFNTLIIYLIFVIVFKTELYEGIAIKMLSQ
jgi:hypothetical protein